MGDAKGSEHQKDSSTSGVDVAIEVKQEFERETKTLPVSELQQKLNKQLQKEALGESAVDHVGPSTRESLGVVKVHTELREVLAKQKFKVAPTLLTSPVADDDCNKVAKSPSSIQSAENDCHEVAAFL